MTPAACLHPILNVYTVYIHKLAGAVEKKQTPRTLLTSEHFRETIKEKYSVTPAEYFRFDIRAVGLVYQKISRYTSEHLESNSMLL